MTKEAAPVCGAVTRKGSLCQNTLVTGCGRCPVHASQLRLAHVAGKPTPHSMKKTYSKRMSSSIRDGLHREIEPSVLQTPDHSTTRTILHHPYQEVSASLRNDSNSVISPGQPFDPVNSVFHTPVPTTFQSTFGTKGEVAIHEIFPHHKNHCSPVTPDNVETSTRLDFFSPADNDAPEEQQFNNEDVLQGHVDSTLENMEYGDLGDISGPKGTMAEPINFSSGLI